MRIGVITGVKEWQGAVDLALVDLASTREIEVVNRDRMDAMLAELSLEASGRTEQGDLRLGRQAKADALIRLEKRRVDEKDTVLLSLLDLRLGAVVWVETLALKEANPRVLADMVVEGVRRYLPRLADTPESLVAMTLLPVRLEETRFDQMRRERELGRALFSAFSNRPGLALLDRDHIGDHLFDLYFTEGATGDFWGAALVAQLTLRPSKDKRDHYHYSLQVTAKNRPMRELTGVGTLPEARKVLEGIADDLGRSLDRPEAVRDPELLRLEAERFSKLAISLQSYDIERSLYYAELAWAMGDVNPHMVSILVNCRLQDACFRVRQSEMIPLNGMPPDIRYHGISRLDFQHRLPLRLKDGSVLGSGPDVFERTLEGIVATQELIRPRLSRLRETKGGWLPVLILNYTAEKMQMNVSGEKELTANLRSLMRRNAEWLRFTQEDVRGSGWFAHKDVGTGVDLRPEWFSASPEEYFDTVRAGFEQRRLSVREMRPLPTWVAFSKTVSPVFPQLPLADTQPTSAEWTIARDRFLVFLNVSPGLGTLQALYLASQQGERPNTSRAADLERFASALAHEMENAKIGEEEWAWVIALRMSLAGEEAPAAELAIWRGFCDRVAAVSAGLNANPNQKTNLSRFEDNWRRYRDRLLSAKREALYPDMVSALKAVDLSHSGLASLRKLAAETADKLQTQAAPPVPAESTGTRVVRYLPPRAPAEGRPLPKTAIGRFIGGGAEENGNWVWTYDPVRKKLQAYDGISGERKREVDVPYDAKRSDERLRVATMTFLGSNGVWALFQTPQVPHLGQLFALNLGTGAWRNFYRPRDANPSGGWYTGIPFPPSATVLFVGDMALLANGSIVVGLPLSEGDPRLVVPEDHQNIPGKPKTLTAPLPWGNQALAFLKLSPDKKTQGLQLQLSILDLSSGEWSSQEHKLPGQLPLYSKNQINFLRIHPGDRQCLLVGTSGALNLAKGLFRPIADMQLGEIAVLPEPDSNPYLDLRRGAVDERWILEHRGAATHYLYADGELWLFTSVFKAGNTLYQETAAPARHRLEP